MLKGKVAVVYGAGGAVGGAVARAFGRDGAVVHLAGRSEDPLRSVAADITARGGQAHWACVDALDHDSVEKHAAAVTKMSGSLDISLNAVGIPHLQGVPLGDLTVHDFEAPVHAYARTNFVTAQVAAGLIAEQGSGVIMTLSTPGSQMPGVGHLGYGVACGAIEAFTRILAGEVGGAGGRAVCLRANAIPESMQTSHVGAIFEEVAKRRGVTVDTWLEGMAENMSIMRRLPTLAQVADVAAFVASDRAGAMTGAIVNVTCGALVD